MLIDNIPSTLNAERILSINILYLKYVYIFEERFNPNWMSFVTET